MNVFSLFPAFIRTPAFECARLPVKIKLAHENNPSKMHLHALICRFYVVWENWGGGHS